MIKTDEELAKATIQDNRNFNPLVERYTQKIRRYITHLTGNWQESEDITQEVFLLAYKNIANFNYKMKFSAWLYRIAHNQSVNFIKKHYRVKNVEFDDQIQNELIENIDYEDLIDKKISARRVKAAVKKLKPKEQEIIYLYYFEEKKYEEIADILQISINSIGPTIKRIKVKLKKIFLEKNDKIRR